MASALDVIKRIGITVILLGLLANPWLVGKLFSFSGKLSKHTSIAVVALEVIILALGAAIVMYRRLISKKRNEIFLLMAALLLSAASAYFLLIDYYEFGWENAWVHDEIRHHKLIPNLNFRLQVPDYNNLTELYLKKAHNILPTRTNSLGLVGGEIDLKDNSKIRIVMLGDSFTEGQYIKENFAEIMEKKLNENAGYDKYQVINAGLGSYSPIVEYNILKHVALELKPEIIILNLDMTDVANDFEYSKQIKYDENKDDYVFVYKKPIILKNQAFENAYNKLRLLFGIWESLLSRIIASKEDDNTITQKINERVELKKRNSGNILLDPVYAYSYKNETEFKNHLNLTLSYVKKISELSSKNGIKFILHSYPHSPQLFKDYPCYREAIGLEKNKIYSNLIFEEMRSFSSKNNITLLLSNDFLRKSETQPYYPCDMHFNQRGHQLVGQFLFDNTVNLTD